MINKIELCDGLVATFNEEDNVYKCNVPWLAREIEVWLSGCDYDDVEIEYMKELFAKFWEQKDNFLKFGQTDIKEKLLPYLAEAEPPEEFVTYPQVSGDDFDADYWLTSVYVICLEDFPEVRLNFNKYDDSEHYDEISVTRSFDGDEVSFFAGCFPVDL